MNIKRPLLYALALLTACATSMSALADNVVLTSTSATYPHERPQWSAEQCAAWQAEYGPIRGINCPIPSCGATSQEDAIALCARMGYNSIRWWPDNSSVDNYIKNVEQWAAWADKYGMTVSPVFGFVYGFYGEKGTDASLKQLEVWVRKITQHFRGDKRIILWDIWNEPNMNDDKTEGMMSWIAQIAKWMQQEGCTQPISSSIVWDTGVNLNNSTATGKRLLRENTERLMDVHNYHDYSCQDGFNQETPSMYNRLKRLGDRPLVCTECMTRTNGSTYARTLIDFAKYNINFYAWGLSACDPNWEAKWSRSTFYNWDPMFHNALYADYEPYNESEPMWVKKFDFQGDFGGAEQGAEYTEVWSTRRAWRWMQHAESKGLLCNSISEAITAVGKHKADGLYNTVAVRVGYKTWNSSNSNTKTQINSLLAAANQAGMTVIPVLLTSDDMSTDADALASYAYNLINAYYADRRVQAWCIYEQTQSTGDGEALKNKLATILRKARYAVQNQPFFMAPKTDGVTPDSTSYDLANWMWKLGDAVGVASGTTDGLLTALMKQHHKPIFQLGCTALTTEMAANHVNWMTDASLPSDAVKAYRFTPLMDSNEDKQSRWTGWKAYRWMNRDATRGLAYANMASALKALNAMRGSTTPYNSVSVTLNMRTFSSRQETFYAEMDSLLKMSDELGMTVLPQLLTDTYASLTTSRLTGYVTDVLTHYATDSRILGWDLYFNACSTSTNTTKAMELADALFAAGRATGAQQPLFMTPCVATNTLPEGYDAVQNLVHGVYAGWDHLNFGKGNVKLCFKMWCQSDIISYTSSQRSELLGWLNAQANKFGRPLFCSQWKPSISEEPSKVLDIFSDMHVSWFVNGTLDATAVQNFHYRPVSTAH